MLILCNICDFFSGFLAKIFLLMMVEQDLTLNADLNDDQSDEYKKKDNEVKRKVRHKLLSTNIYL